VPVLLKGVFEGRALRRELSRLGLKGRTPEKVFVANRSTLVFFREDERVCSAPDELVPDDDTVKEIVAVHEYVERFKLLINMERLAEIQLQGEEMRKLSGRERELLGRAILDLKGSRAGTKFHFTLVKFGGKSRLKRKSVWGMSSSSAGVIP
jgi:hypothetical protein